MNIKTRQLFLLSLMSLFTICASPAWAGYYTVLDTGEVMKPGTYKMTGDAQFLTEDGGLNVGASIDAGFQDEFGLRGLAGFGHTDFFFGGLFKWSPIPDIENQPAISFNFGVLYAKDGSVRDLTFRFEPIISKRVPIEDVVFTPYASIPLSQRVRNSDDSRIDDSNKLTAQLALGTQVQVPAWKQLQFMAEIGIDLEDTPGYFSVGALIYFDEERGIKIE